jgi:hypothetical protein
MKSHLLVDFFGGLLLAVSPWLFGFSSYVNQPHVALGIFSMVAALITKKHPLHGPRTHRLV